ncbi:hypothetical protein BG005_011654 [Podila minutissima]|nr:hypothetical protein BG005_011654 [Podila minutissima]
MHKQPTEIPELLVHISRYLTTPALFACIQVSVQWHHAFIPSLWHTIDDTAHSWNNILWQCSDPAALSPIWLSNMDEKARDSDTNKDREWILHVFRKYGHHIRDLSVHWSMVLEAANESCQALKSLSLDIRVESATEPPVTGRTLLRVEEVLLEDELPFAFSTPLFPDLFEEGDYVRPQIHNDRMISHQAKQEYLERLWTMLQQYWHLTFSNPGLVRLSFARDKVFPWGIRSEQVLYQRLAKLTHLKELHGWALDSLSGIWRLLEAVPTIESLTPNCYWIQFPNPIPEVNTTLRTLTMEATLNVNDLHTLLGLFPNLSMLTLYMVTHPEEDDHPDHDQIQAQATTTTTPVGTNLVAFNAMLKDGKIPLCLPQHVELTYHDHTSESEMPLVLTQHPTRFTVFKALHSPWSLEEERRGRRDRDHANEVLASCARLRVFDSITRYICADEMLRRPWACMGLEWLSCRIVGVDRLTDVEQAMVGRVMAPGYMGELSVDEAAAVEKFQRCRTQQHGVYDRLASLTRLRHLDLGCGNRYPWTYRSEGWYDVGGDTGQLMSWDGEDDVEWIEGSAHLQYDENSMFDTLELSLASGLDRLGALKNLEMIGFERVNHRIGRAELAWMAKSWPRLSLMYGLDQDLTYGVEPDETRAELKEYFQQLRPDVVHAHGTLFADHM